MPTLAEYRAALENDIAEFDEELEKLPGLRRRLGIAPPNCHREIEMEAPEENDDELV